MSREMKPFEELTHTEKIRRIIAFFDTRDNGLGKMRQTWINYIFSDGLEYRELYVKYLKYFMQKEC